MRAVNLIPVEDRRGGGGAGSGLGSYIVLGVLAVVVAMSASYTLATICSSARTSSACRIHASRRSVTSAAISPSPKLSCARRIAITASASAAPAHRRRRAAARD